MGDPTLSRRDYLATTAAVAGGLAAGCLTGQQLYRSNANSYLLDAGEVPAGDWTTTKTREPNFSPPELTSGRAREFVAADGRGLTVAVLIYETVDAAESFMADQRTQYENNGYEVSREDLADEAHSVAAGDRQFVDVRHKNAFVQAYGTVHLSNAKAIAQAQLDALTE